MPFTDARHSAEDISAYSVIGSGHSYIWKYVIVPVKESSDTNKVCVTFAQPPEFIILANRLDMIEGLAFDCKPSSVRSLVSHTLFGTTSSNTKYNI